MNKYLFYSDQHKMQDFILDIKNRSLESKHLYMNDGALNFYNAKEIQLDSLSWYSVYLKFIKDHILKDKNKKYAFISFGCGKDDLSKYILSALYEEGFTFDYYAVDSSSKMLILHEDNFKDVKFNVIQVLSDFSKYDFKRNLQEVLLDNYDLKIFAFFGATIGNIKLTNTADTFQNILDKGDILWNDCVVQKDNLPNTKIDRFNYYLSFFKDKPVADFFKNPLKQINIPDNSGELFLRMTQEKSTGTILYTVGFRFKQKVDITYKRDNIIFLPEEEFNLFNIRDYTADPFIKFFESHNLKNRGFCKENTIGQFLFEKI
jgi:hypothetical protein